MRTRLIATPDVDVNNIQIDCPELLLCVNITRRPIYVHMTLRISMDLTGYGGNDATISETCSGSGFSAMMQWSDSSPVLMMMTQYYKNTHIDGIFTARNARIASAVLATAIPSVRPSVCLSVRLSVTRRYCVKTTARSTVQFAPLDSKMCLVL